MTTDRFIQRQSWTRFDKLWALGGVLFYGAPCWALLIGSFLDGSLWVALAAGGGLLIFGVFNWRMRARTAGALEAEVTPQGIRFRDDQRPIPWTDVARVEFFETGGGTYQPTQDHIALHLHSGSSVSQRLDPILRIQLEKVVAQFAPQVPLGPDRPAP